MSFAQIIIYSNPFEKWLWQSGLGWWFHGIIMFVLFITFLVYALAILDDLQIKARTAWAKRRRK